MNVRPSGVEKFAGEFTIMPYCEGFQPVIPYFNGNEVVLNKLSPVKPRATSWGQSSLID